VRIGFLGNVNNYPFMMARALRRMGHDVLFIVDRREPLNRPENRYADISVPYPDWIVDLSPLDIHVPQPAPPPARAKAVSLLRSCDAVFLNMMGPSLSDDVRRPSFVMLTGSDLEDYADYGFVRRYLRAQWRGARWRPLGHARENLNNIRDQFLALARLVAAQRRGIRAASAVSYFARGMVPKADALLDRIGVPDAKRMFLIMTEPDRIAFRPPPDNRVVRVFNVARLTWKKAPGEIPTGGASKALDFKGTDAMVRGLAMFARKSGAPLDIRLVRKGRHVAETEALVEAEGLSGQVTWADEMTQAEVFEEYRRADIVFDQLGDGMISMGCLDAMSSGRPVIANGRPDLIEKALGVPSPVCQAKTDAEVCAQLERLVPDRAERERVGIASRRFVEAHFSAEAAARRCLERLEAS
jgi:glycosyltransferase involved in cell wall biosynthesis